MIVGRRENLKTIWDIIPDWVIRSDEGCLGFARFRFDKDETRWVGWATWQRPEALIDMTDEE